MCRFMDALTGSASASIPACRRLPLPTFKLADKAADKAPSKKRKDRAEREEQERDDQQSEPDEQDDGEWTPQADKRKTAAVVKRYRSESKSALLDALITSTSSSSSSSSSSSISSGTSSNSASANTSATCISSSNENETTGIVSDASVPPIGQMTPCAPSDASTTADDSDMLDDGSSMLCDTDNHRTMSTTMTARSSSAISTCTVSMQTSGVIVQARHPIPDRMSQIGHPISDRMSQIGHPIPDRMNPIGHPIPDRVSQIEHHPFATSPLLQSHSTTIASSQDHMEYDRQYQQHFPQQLQLPQLQLPPPPLFSLPPSPGSSSSVVHAFEDRIVELRITDQDPNLLKILQDANRARLEPSPSSSSSSALSPRRVSPNPF